MIKHLKSKSKFKWEVLSAKMYVPTKDKKTIKIHDVKV